MNAILLLTLTLTADPLPRAEGYHGSWYSNGTTNDEYKFKYSGGTATYPTQHSLIAVYAHAVNKTFFVYGGKHPDSNSILHMVSYYDHTTGTVPKPAILLDKKTTDAHDNPTMQIDKDGHLWIFSNAHGTGRPSFVHRSVQPYSIDAFEKTWETNFSYGVPWVLPDGRFLFLHTKYNDGRELRWTTSVDGRTWAEPTKFAKIDKGNYRISWQHKDKVGTAFDYHPSPVGLDARTNFYYLETTDGGTTWHTADGRVAKLPLTKVKNVALVHDYAAEKKLVYMKDLNFDADGRPVVLFITSTGHRPGPADGPHEWHTARWTGKDWTMRRVTAVDHNYDHGSLYIEADGAWRIIGSSAPGPQPFGTGGEMEMWTSTDQGQSWTKVKTLTHDSKRNHAYPRRPLNAHPDFYALWADGDARKRSASDLFFCNRDGSKVYRLPRKIIGDSAAPEEMK